jgi:hypothetical protein
MLHIRLVLTLVLALVAASVHAATARAGTYNVRACWGTEADGWQAVGNRLTATADAYQSCPANGGGTGLAASLLPMAGTWPRGSVVGNIFTSPPNTRVIGITADAESWQSPYITRTWGRGLWDADTGQLIAPFSTTSNQINGVYKSFAMTGFSVGRLLVGLRCVDSECPIEGPVGIPDVLYMQFRQTVAVRNVVLTVEDNAKPNVTVDPSPPVGWVGNGAFPVATMADDNVGVRLSGCTWTTCGSRDSILAVTSRSRTWRRDRVRSTRRRSSTPL